MSSAAEFFAVVAHRDDTNSVGVFLAEQSHRAAGLSFFFRHEVNFDRRSFGDSVVDDVFDSQHLFRRDGCSVREVETENVVFNLGASLHGVITQNRVQRVMQQVCG